MKTQDQEVPVETPIRTFIDKRFSKQIEVADGVYKVDIEGVGDIVNNNLPKVKPICNNNILVNWTLKYVCF